MNNQGGNFQFVLPIPIVSLTKVFMDLKNMQKDNLNDIPIESKQQKGEEEIKGLKFIAKKIKILLEKNKKIEYNEASRILINNFASEEKAQRNIKRRVYDAINVLVSAGVIAKDDNKIQLVHQRQQYLKNQINLTNKSNKPELETKIAGKKQMIEKKNEKMKQLKSKLNLFRKIFSKKANKNKKDVGDQILIIPWSGKIQSVQINKKKKQICIKGGRSKEKLSNLIQYISNEGTKCKINIQN